MTKRCLLVLLAVVFGLVLPNMAFALQDPTPPPDYKGNIVANQYEKEKVTISNPNDPNVPGPYGDGDYKEYIWGSQMRPYTATSLNTYNDSLDTSTHVYGTWNSPYALGVDGFNYNDPQDYVYYDNTAAPNRFKKQLDRGDSINDPLDSDPSNNITVAGPHGGYLTSTHKCRECHAVHRAAGKFKLTRSDTRFEACDWCHGTGAGSGFNIQMDNDDDYTTEYNVGHTMGFGIESGKWKAPDDTYPAFTPNYYMGGFTCFDCHSPHANPSRMLGFNDSGIPVGKPADLDADTITETMLSINNPGSDTICEACHSLGINYYRPIYPSGSWLLVKDADREIATADETIVPNPIIGEDPITVTPGTEIPDLVTAGLYEFSETTLYPVNKAAVDWNTPIGLTQDVLYTGERFPIIGETVRNPYDNVWTVTEFCIDCHDGNSGLHTQIAPMFSEDRALRNQTTTSDNQGNAPGDADGVSPDDTSTLKGFYDLAYSHEENPRHCARQMLFNPENTENYGPHCRNCHRGSSGCGKCHTNDYTYSGPGVYSGRIRLWSNNCANSANDTYDRWPDSEVYVAGFIPIITYVPYPPYVIITYEPLYMPIKPGPVPVGVTTYNPRFTSTNFSEGMSFSENNNNFVPFTNISHQITADQNYSRAFMYKTSRTVDWNAGWRDSEDAVEMGQRMDPATGAGVECSDDGFSWPHRTLGWMMLKDDLFGLDFDGDIIAVGDTRTYGSSSYTAHDLDSVCLDCHNPTVYRATGPSHEDDPDPAKTFDDYNDELLLRGLP